ncbi:MAG: hypothetical protein QY332_10350 [Anaerolineales bacterium]|nr:MAG: hypothetical protein QY332_10350 [Anaerolineales bacterium]
MKENQSQQEIVAWQSCRRSKKIYYSEFCRPTQQAPRLRGANGLTLGTASRRDGVRKSQAVFYALSFFWLDGFAVPALVVELAET